MYIDELLELTLGKLNAVHVLGCDTAKFEEIKRDIRMSIEASRKSRERLAGQTGEEAAHNDG